MFYDLKRLLTETVPLILQEGLSQGTSSPLSSARVLKMVNLAYNEMYRKAEEQRVGQLVDYLNLDVDDVETRRLSAGPPLRCASRICMVRRNADVPDASERAAVSFRPQSSGDRNMLDVVQYRLAPDGRIYLMSSFDSSTTFRLWYTIKVPELHHSLVASTQPTSKTVVHLSTNPDNGTFDRTPGIYAGQLGYHYETAQFFQIASCTKAGVATVAKPGTTDALDEDIEDETEYCLLPFLNDHYELLATLAASKYKKLDSAQMILGDLQTLLSSYLDWINPGGDDVSPVLFPDDHESDFGLDLNL